MKQDCKTKYPILLAHGLAAPDSGVRHPPWGRGPQLLRDRGAVVYMGGQDAWGSIENGAARLEQVLYRMLQEQDCSRVNIIAHSKGGLEARYLISTLGHGRHVASLTMLSTPNRGSRVAAVCPAGGGAVGAGQRCVLGAVWGCLSGFAARGGTADAGVSCAVQPGKPGCCLRVLSKLGGAARARAYGWCDAAHARPV